MHHPYFAPSISLLVLLSACSAPNDNSASKETAAPANSNVAVPAGVPADGGVQVLPLKKGVFVLAGTSCKDPPNSAIRIFDGQGLSGSTTKACRATVNSTAGKTYTVSQSCVDTYTDKRTAELQKITINHDNSFAISTNGGTKTFAYCAGAARPESAAATNGDRPGDTPVKPNSDWQSITLKGYRCGDNCYVEFTMSGQDAKNGTALCSADVCGDWERAGALPDNLVNKRAEVKFGTGVRVDGNSNQVDSYRKITMIRFSK